MRSNPTTSITAKPSIYQVVTDRILESLKKGIVPWQKPWQAPTYAGGSFPRNFCTGKPYRGVNISSTLVDALQRTGARMRCRLATEWTNV